MGANVMKYLRSFLSDPADFLTWLVAQPADTTYGCMSTNCPLAEYLNAKNPRYEHSVNCGHLTAWRRDGSFTGQQETTPIWCGRFIGKYDSRVPKPPIAHRMTLSVAINAMEDLINEHRAI